MSTENQNGVANGSNNVEAMLAQLLANQQRLEKQLADAEARAAAAQNVATRGKARQSEPSHWRYKGMKLNHFVGRGGKPSDRPFVLVATFRKEYADGSAVINPVNGSEQWLNSGNGMYADWVAALSTIPAEDVAIFSDPAQVAMIENDKDAQALAKAESAERNAKRAEKGSGKQTGIGESDIARALAFLGRRK